MTHLRDLHLLSAKPFVYVFNVDESALGASHDDLTATVDPAPSVVVCAQIEAELVGLQPRSLPFEKQRERQTPDRGDLGIKLAAQIDRGAGSPSWIQGAFAYFK